MECLLSTFINRLKDITCATDPNEHDMHRLKLTVAKAMLYNASPDIITEASLLHKRLDAELGTYCHMRTLYLFCIFAFLFTTLFALFIHLFIRLFIYSFIYSFIYLSIYLFIFIFFSFYSFSLLKCISIIHSFLFINLSISLFIFSFHYFFIFPSSFIFFCFLFFLFFPCRYFILTILFFLFRNDSSDGISTHGPSAYGKPP